MQTLQLKVVQLPTRSVLFYEVLNVFVLCGFFVLFISFIYRLWVIVVYRLRTQTVKERSFDVCLKRLKPFRFSLVEHKIKISNKFFVLF